MKRRLVTSEAWRRFQVALDETIEKREEAKQNRKDFIAALKRGRKAGMTLEQLGKVFGVTRERIRQFLKEDYPTP